jgi:hypothetical protein
VWFLLHGQWPEHDIDHIDGNRANNRPGNLRALSRAQNMQNLKVAHVDSTTRLLGVHFDARRSKWGASITKSGRSRFLGYHASPEAAHAAYVSEKRRIHEANTL